MPDRRVIVFAGPCLSKRLAAPLRPLLAQVDLRPPAQRGDVLAALCDHPDTLVLLDGYYETVLSVTHKELLYAIHSGVRVIGAASMGALRAAELAGFGMLGVGRIFDLFRSGDIDGDDEVAILHAPEHLGYEPLTIALVELRLTVDALVREQCIPRDSGARFIQQVKSMSFRHRRLARVRSVARRTFGRPATRHLERRVRRERFKETDARHAVELALTRTPVPTRRVTTETAFLHRFKEQTFRVPDIRPLAQRPTVQQSWFLAQLFHPECALFVRWLRLRHLLFSECASAGLGVAAERYASILCTLRAYHERKFGSTWLPSVEYEEEARIHTMAEAACQTFGNDHGACASFARRLGISPGNGKSQLVRLLEGQPDALPSWWQARAFTFTEVFEPAQALAAEAGAVFRCFRRWSGGARVQWSSLMDVAASIWSCGRSAIFAEGARRGLFLIPAASEGLREALELVAAAERLVAPINQYAYLRNQLQRSPLRFVVELAGTHADERADEDRLASGVEVLPLPSVGPFNHGRRPFICDRLLYQSPALSRPV